MSGSYTKEPLEVVGNLVRTDLRSGGFLVAEFRDSGGNPHSEEAKANARLFAESRQLLEALGDLVAGLEKTNWSSWQTTAHFSAALEFAQSLIAKAQGEQA
jgi:hypothetical protein